MIDIENANNKYGNLSEEKKKQKENMEKKKNEFKEWLLLFFLYNTKMSEKTLKLVNVIANKNKFHASKKSIAINLIDTEKILMSHIFKHSDKGFKCFVGYLDDNIIRALCII